jgi:hypothetical protein
LQSMTVSLAVFVGLTFLGAAEGRAKQPDTESADVFVHLHNAGVATPGTVERAKLIATSMFATIGINLHWRLSEPEQLGPLVDITLAAGESSREDENEPLAEAYPFAGSTGHITVRYERVRSSAGISRDLEAILLGHVMVHEITHILQCLDRHSETGVMKARWSSDDYCEMRWKPLTFTPEDIELIHLGMKALRSRAETQPEMGHPEPSR